MAEELKYISLAEAAKITNYSQDYISLLCRQGKLKAQKLGRNWVTTREWVENYVDTTTGTGVNVVPVHTEEAAQKATAEPSVPVAAICPASNKQRLRHDWAAALDEEVKEDWRLGVQTVLSPRERVLAWASIVAFVGLFFYNALLFYRYTTQEHPIVSVGAPVSVPAAVAENSMSEKSQLTGGDDTSVGRNFTLSSSASASAADFQIATLKDRSALPSREELIAKLQPQFSEEIDVQILDGYALIFFTRHPEQKFLYH